MSSKIGVSIVFCADYHMADVDYAIDKTFKYFGGIENVIKRGAKVLLKPNLIKKSLPEECTITHPVVIETVAKKVLEIGATPIIGDSPAFGAVSKIARCMGLERFARLHNIKIIELNTPRKVETRCGHRLFSLPLSGKALDVDAIINIPKLKAHAQLLFTAAVKNMYGCVSGKRKAWYHFISNNDITWYTEMLLANYQAVRPVFTIVDAIMAMEKRGPSGGVPRQVSLIIGGADCVAIDRVIAEIINASPSLAPLLNTAKMHNIGEQDLDKIEILGEPLASVKIPDYDLPKLLPIGFKFSQVVKSLIKHLWLKRFGKAV